jgi:hypothetical protein
LLNRQSRRKKRRSSRWSKTIYRVLGVEATSDLETIKRAFRQKAKVCHPDRGGSHEQMVAVLEAWEVLSDPEKRRRYDEARTLANDRVAQEAAAADTRQARQRAEQYPRRWAEMEAWLNGLTADFTRAEYGSTTVGGAGSFPTIPIPTAGGSATGWAFIVIGAVLGGWLLSTTIYDFLSVKVAPVLYHGQSQRNRTLDLIGLILVVAPVVAGAWAGAALHRVVSDAIKRSQNDRARQAQREQHGEPRRTEEERRPAGEAKARIVGCEKCGQKLRVPSLQDELLVTCRSCGHRFPLAPG